MKRKYQVEAKAEKEEQDLIELLQTHEALARKMKDECLANSCQRTRDLLTYALFIQNYKNPRIKQLDSLPLLPDIVQIVAGFYEHELASITNLQIEQSTKLDTYEYKSEQDGDLCQQKNLKLSFCCNNITVNCHQAMWFYANAQTPTQFDHFFGFCGADQNYSQQLSITLHRKGKKFSIDNAFKATLFEFIHDVCMRFCNGDPFNVPHVRMYFNEQAFSEYQMLLPDFHIL